MAGVIEVDLFDKDVNREDHPEVLKFKKVLLEVAAGLSTRSFSALRCAKERSRSAFDSDELTAEILNVLQEIG
jgi:hypothetical protein